MGGVYTAIFLIPNSVDRILGEDGWEFISNKRLSENLVVLLVNQFALTEDESYLGVTVYLGDHMKFSVIRDDAGLIEQISIQVHRGSSVDIAKEINELRLDCVELFIPTKH